MFKNEIKLIEYEWKHYNTILTILVILLTLKTFLNGSLENFLKSLATYGYLGGFISGFLFTYGITTPFAIAMLFILAENLNIWILTAIGTLGGLVSEYFIYKFAINEAGKTIKIYGSKKIKLPKIKSKFLKKISPLIAGIIIASPIPDEFVAVLFGIEKYKLRDFLILTFIFKFIGIFFIVGLGKILD